MNFRYRIAQFLSGRYGADTLFNIIVSASLILAFINLFLRFRIIQIIVYLLMIWGFFRFFSRNTEKRRKENEWVLKQTEFIKRRRELSRQRRNDKCHIYKKCPRCKAILRLPKRPGKHRTVCPKCSHEFTVRVKAD